MKKQRDVSGDVLSFSSTDCSDTRKNPKIAKPISARRGRKKTQHEDSDELFVVESGTEDNEKVNEVRMTTRS